VDLAHRYLRDAGLRVVARNRRQPQGVGEIDLIACESSASGRSCLSK
jgi:Holliday junction resolvase-like predicted endonuclease